jgi:hypothetical protein
MFVAGMGDNQSLNPCGREVWREVYLFGNCSKENSLLSLS